MADVFFPRIDLHHREKVKMRQFKGRGRFPKRPRHLLKPLQKMATKGTQTITPWSKTRYRHSVWGLKGKFAYSYITIPTRVYARKI